MTRRKTQGGKVLEEEIQYFNDSLGEWLKQYSGRVVLVKGKELIGVYDTETEALAEGARQFQLQPFLVRRVIDKQPDVSVPALALGILNACSTRPA